VGSYLRGIVGDLSNGTYFAEMLARYLRNIYPKTGSRIRFE